MNEVVERLAKKWENGPYLILDDGEAEADVRWWLEAIADEIADSLSPVFIPTVHPEIQRAIYDHHRDIVGYLRRWAAATPEDTE